MQRYRCPRHLKKKIYISERSFRSTGRGAGRRGQGCLPAALMALEDVNAEPNLLPGYKMKMPYNDSQCNPGLGATVMYDLLYNPPQKLILLGGCSIVCSTIAEAAKMWNLVVVSYGSSSPALSNRKRFPTFFRTHPSATIHNPTRIKLFQKFKWSRIAIIQEAEEVFISTGEDLEARCKEAGIEVATRQSFISDPTDAVRNLVRQDARIIVGMFYVAAARKVICEAYKQNVFGRQYVWFLIGWYEDDWYTFIDKAHNCTVQQMKEAVEGHLTTEALMLNQGAEPTISGMTSAQFLERYEEELKKYNYIGRRPVGYQEAPLAYDAIWAIALALNKTINQLKLHNKSIEDFSYTNDDIAKQIYSAMNSTQFLGVSGYVAFSSKGDRIAWTQIEQMIDGNYTLLGYYDTQTDNLTWLRKEKWADGKPPADRTIIKKVLRTVTLSLFISMTTVSGLGILWALVLLIFNTIFRHSSYYSKWILRNQYKTFVLKRKMHIKNTKVLCLITAPVTLVISSQTDATYAFVSLAIIVCSFLSMALIFIPKVIELIRRPRERVDCRTLTDTITSREEEDRQQRLQRENEELRRQIIEREDQIRQATLTLQERSAMRHMASTMGGGDRVRITVGQYTDLLAPKDITNDFISDSGFITGTSMARSSRSDTDFSESYL
ncbi:gamma-aminobutyric acid type B receptor subunit 1 [Trichonephila inaurata madagascariensis]|uniref:Gamma-aminobutyric acid type B receptor subunit 1 n=1 Tax=Trichonephila inaurata madagascariensis TaxID=2747483 RepID=A0A8X7C553_9ARAC|nr:gamma-aminobutyric acid type B receptor subunit 1 [Trichonephila inaurata madagascariensis]